MLKVACFDFNLRVDIICRNSGTTDLSVGSTETKYIKLKTKTQKDIVILGIFHKK